MVQSAVYHMRSEVEKGIKREAKPSTLLVQNSPEHDILQYSMNILYH